MKMVSYWQNVSEIHEDDGLVFIIGTYEHKKSGNPIKSLGIHWGTYPQSHNILSPCVVPTETASIILAGLLQKAVLEKNQSHIETIMHAIQYLQE